MSVIELTDDLAVEVKKWRHDIHRNPELAYEEERTSALVASVLESIGLEVHRGIGGTGVIGILRNGRGTKSIALRADMDALPLSEDSNLPYKSVVEKKMHACGHDGHTAMLLGAAKLLANIRDFDGTVFFIFQPAEEHLDGAYKMIDDGLFEIAPADVFFGMHNWPGLPVGEFAIRTGPMLASFDKFDILVRGVGGHGAMPHNGIDSILVASQIINTLQSIVSRNINPTDSSVISITHINGGEPSYNVIPDIVTIKGAVRTLDSKTRKTIKLKLNHLVAGIADSLGAKCEIEYKEVCPVLVNSPLAVKQAICAAKAVAGDEKVNRNVDPTMGSEDFAAVLEKRLGAYVFIGNGDGLGSCMIHNPKYDFNDAVIPYGVKFWCQLVRSHLCMIR